MKQVQCYTLNEGMTHIDHLSHCKYDLVLNWTGFTMIDYMTIDTEGSELSILEAFDFDRHVVRYIQIETIGAEKATRTAIDKLMYSKGYVIVETVFLGFDTYDVIFQRTHRADLQRILNLRVKGWPSSIE